MLRNRIIQFFLIYITGILFLLSIKYILNLSDYVIPAPMEIGITAKAVGIRYLGDVLNTVVIAVIGHVISIVLAFSVGILGGQKSWAGALVKTAAYNIQAYPIVAVAPLIFILLGDGLLSRMIISVMICYFPLLLSVMGVLSDPVESIEHFYRITRRITWKLQVKIRIFENFSNLSTVIVGSATMAMVGTIVAEFIASNAGIGYSIRIALYQSDMAKILIALFWIGICTSGYLTGIEQIGFYLHKRMKAD
ncbi:MAG: ABC transporter permease subunit [Desulfatirhabdiaceae bacterium]